MTKSIKAALLSALVFPGAGHILLKKYISSAILMSASFGGIYFIITNTIEKALHITQQIQSGQIQLDVTGIAELVSKQSTGTAAQLENIATTIVIISWLVGIIDAYRVGRAQDKEAENNRIKAVLLDARKNNKL